jgi:hypothetical protein
MAAQVRPVVIIPTRNTPLPVLLVGEGICQGHSQAFGPKDWLLMYPEIWEEVQDWSTRMNVKMKTEEMSIDFKPLDYAPPTRNGKGR